jgi:nucleoid DNA-binding protein
MAEKQPPNGFRRAKTEKNPEKTGKKSRKSLELLVFFGMFGSFSSKRIARTHGGQPHREGGSGGILRAAILRMRRTEGPMAKKEASKGAGKAKAATKGEVFTDLAEKTSLSKKQIASVFEALDGLVKKELGKKGPGLFQIPGLLKLKVVRKPATKASMGINPFTKEPMMKKAKPARNVVRAVPLKALKDSV